MRVPNRSTPGGGKIPAGSANVLASPPEARKIPPMVKRILLLPMLVLPCLGAGCATEGVAARQESISNLQGRILENRAERIKARDERMWNSRDVWFD